MSDHTSDNSVSDFLTYVSQVYALATKYNTEIKNSSDVSTANLVAMEYLRHSKYGGWSWVQLLGSWHTDFVDYASKNGAPTRIKDYQDPWPEKIWVDHLFAAMNGFWLFGKAVLTQPPLVNEGDISGWGGDWIGCYADWINSSDYSNSEGEAFVQKFLGNTIDGYHFNLRPCIEDADGFNIANYLLSNPTVPLDQACNNYFNPPAGGGGYKTRFDNFYSARFGGKTESMVDIATAMILQQSNVKVSLFRGAILAADLPVGTLLINSYLPVLPITCSQIRLFAKGYDDALQSLITQEKAK